MVLDAGFDGFQVRRLRGHLVLVEEGPLKHLLRQRVEVLARLLVGARFAAYASARFSRCSSTDWGREGAAEGSRASASWMHGCLAYTLRRVGCPSACAAAPHL